MPAQRANPAPMLFALAASQAFATQVAQRLGIALSPLEERAFEDGEHKSRSLVCVRARDVYVLHALYADQQQSGNDKLCRLLFLIASLKDAGAARVTAVVPYLAYARKDRRSAARDPVTTRYVAALFEAVGVDAVLTIDVHNLAAFQNAFRCRSEHLEASQLLLSHIAPGLAGRPVVVVAPDAGGIKRAEQFREGLARMLDRPVASALAEKYRSGGVLSGERLFGEVHGMDALIIDDLVSSGATLVRTARSCRTHGAVRVIAAATHGLFMGDAPRQLADAALDQIVVTDTVPAFRLAGSAALAKLQIVSCAPLFAAAIASLHAGRSVSALMHS